MKFQGLQAFSPTLFVHPVSSFKKDITAVAIEISTTTAVFTNSFCPITRYIFYEAPREEKNFATLLDMIDASEVREDDETYMNPIDRLFEALEKKEPTHFAVKQYKKYKLAAGVIELRRTLHHYFSEICTS